MNPVWMADFEPLLTPPAVGWWPLAPGWWVVAALVCLLIALAGWAAWRHWSRNRYRRALIHELDALWQCHYPDRNTAGIEPYLTGCCELIRRTWRLLDPSRAALPTRALLLDLESTPGVEVPIQLLDRIDQILYGPLPDGWDSETLALARFHRHLLLWSRRHRQEVAC